MDLHIQISRFPFKLRGSFPVGIARNSLTEVTIALVAHAKRASSITWNWSQLAESASFGIRQPRTVVLLSVRLLSGAWLLHSNGVLKCH